MSEFHSFVRVNSISLRVSTIFYLPIRVLMDIWIVSIFCLVNNAAMNVECIWVSAFHSFLYIARSGIAGSCSNSMFNFLRNRSVGFHDSHTFLYPPQPYSWVRKTPLEKGMDTHSSFLAWRIPWTDWPGELQSIGSRRVGLDWVAKTFHFHPQQCTGDPVAPHPCQHLLSFLKIIAILMSVKLTLDF